LARKDLDTTTAAAKHPREEDMVKRVLGVMAAVSSRVPLSVFSNSYFRMYTQALDSKHRPPHHLETNRIIKVLIDGAFAEFLRIVEDRRTLLGGGFTSLSTDFVTDSVRRESFGVILTELVAEKFDLEDGRSLHMSKETAGNLSSELLSVSFQCNCQLLYSNYLLFPFVLSIVQVHPKLANLNFQLTLKSLASLKPSTT
jgi:hypothetical protein